MTRRFYPETTVEDSTLRALASYLDTLLWSETLSVPEDGEGNPGTMIYEGAEFRDGTPLDQIISRDDLPDAIVDSARKDLEGFAESCVRELGLNPIHIFDPAQVGHDFALSRNGHGAGFFDDVYEIAVRCPHTSTDDRGTGLFVRVQDRLQDIAGNMGTHGLTVWVDDHGTLQVEDHS